MHFLLLRRCYLIAAALAAGLTFATADGAPAAAPGVLGVAVANPSTPPQGALIALVAPAGAAERAGLRPQDLIVQADAQPILSASDLTAYVATHRAGDRITLIVMRSDGASTGRIEVTATLGQAAAQGSPGAAGSMHSGGASPRPSTPAAAPAQGLSRVSWTTFTDPYENAFSIEVPQGWKVAGGVVRKIPLWPQHGGARPFARSAHTDRNR